LSGCVENARSSKPATWDIQLAAAIQAATEQDNSAILTTVMAHPKNGFSSQWSPETGAWDLRFDFREGVSGNEVIVTFEDTAIEQTKDIELQTPVPITPAPSAPTRTPLQPHSLPDLLETFKIGPREAVSITLADAAAQASQLDISISPGCYGSVGPTSKFWYVTYRSVPRDQVLPRWQFSYTVDATTGEIRERSYEQVDNTQ
jgi:hypothetical protein